MAGKRKPSVIAPTAKAIADAVLDGHTLTEAAGIAGCTVQNAHHHVKNSQTVKEYLATHRSALSDTVQLKRADVITGFMEAIDTARLAADPGAMIRGWAEIGKMLGLYEPEVKKIEISATQRNISSKYEVMSDEDLLAIAEGRVGETIEGEFSERTEPSAS